MENKTNFFAYSTQEERDKNYTKYFKKDKMICILTPQLIEDSTIKPENSVYSGTYLYGTLARSDNFNKGYDISNFYRSKNKFEQAINEIQKKIEYNFNNIYKHGAVSYFEYFDLPNPFYFSPYIRRLYHYYKQSEDNHCFSFNIHLYNLSPFESYPFNIAQNNDIDKDYLIYKIIQSSPKCYFGVKTNSANLLIIQYTFANRAIEIGANKLNILMETQFDSNERIFNVILKVRPLQINQSELKKLTLVTKTTILKPRQTYNDIGYIANLIDNSGIPTLPSVNDSSNKSQQYPSRDESLKTKLDEAKRDFDEQQLLIDIAQLKKEIDDCKQKMNNECKTITDELHDIKNKMNRKIDEIRTNNEKNQYSSEIKGYNLGHLDLKKKTEDKHTEFDSKLNDFQKEYYGLHRNHLQNYNQTLKNSLNTFKQNNETKFQDFRKQADDLKEKFKENQKNTYNTFITQYNKNHEDTTGRITKWHEEEKSQFENFKSGFEKLRDAFNKNMENLYLKDPEQEKPQSQKQDENQDQENITNPALKQINDLINVYLNDLN